MTEASLYERLGGSFAIAAVVDHFSDAVVAGDGERGGTRCLRRPQGRGDRGLLAAVLSPNGEGERGRYSLPSPPTKAR